MRLLVLSKKRNGGHVNDPIHRGFFESFPGMVAWYGPGETNDLDKPLNEVVKSFRPDLILVNMKKRVGDWLTPAMISKLDVPKALVEVDFCYERSELARKWYRDCHFDIIFFRHYLDAITPHGIVAEQQWLPFSVKPEWLCRPEDSERLIKVGFLGTRAPPDHYAWRNWAIESLKATIPYRKLYGEGYMRWFRQCQIAIACGSKYQLQMAKHVIIPGAGALLLADKTEGLDILLPEGSYLTCPMGGDIGSVVAKALSDPARLAGMATKAHEAVRTLHLHENRWRQIVEALCA